ncbi:hypothetical protein FKZ61_009105 [Litorilinea aerophila]|uniref:Uncharacterized protein n=1 Tax=Litorilinea aerophila TaxID=1204385 RepID=A0A540VHH2_9CHLR|nr:hypothetical protein [Litorilinea aerophila]MCC9076267.1 hypothetical protein [Litorilinea aerophila]
MGYFYIRNRELHYAPGQPAGLLSLGDHPQALLPPLVTELHRSLDAWFALGLAPGPVLPERLRFDREGTLYWRFAGRRRPRPLALHQAAQTLAAWLVLLDKWMETFVVIARARGVWDVPTLAGALSFTTPAYLPAPLVNRPPDNWERVAQALALAVADGPLAGAPNNRHWQLQRSPNGQAAPGTDPAMHGPRAGVSHE